MSDPLQNSFKIFLKRLFEKNFLEPGAFRTSSFAKFEGSETFFQYNLEY